MLSVGHMEECSDSSGVAADHSLPSSSRLPGDGDCKHLVSGAVLAILCQNDSGILCPCSSECWVTVTSALPKLRRLPVRGTGTPCSHFWEHVT